MEEGRGGHRTHSAVRPYGAATWCIRYFALWNLRLKPNLRLHSSEEPTSRFSLHNGGGRIAHTEHCYGLTAQPRLCHCVIALLWAGGFTRLCWKCKLWSAWPVCFCDDFVLSCDFHKWSSGNRSRSDAVIRCANTHSFRGVAPVDDFLERSSSLHFNARLSGGQTHGISYDEVNCARIRITSVFHWPDLHFDM